MRLLHTSDWHLGHTLHDVSREREHARFLDWLLEVLHTEAVDALVITGDVFETANPGADAQTMYYDFLARARRRFPALDIVVIGGNHDSAARLDAPGPVLRALAVHILGGLPRLASGAIDAHRLVVPLHDHEGRIAAWIAAVPFLRPSDLPLGDIGEVFGDRLVEGVRRVYEVALEAARARREPGQALLATGHLYMEGTILSEQSERKVLGGNQHALPVNLFPEELAYVALGHLHLAQTVGARSNVRYAGSPIPLSLAEGIYQHQVCLVELDGPDLVSVTSLRVPRMRDILRLPEDGPLPLTDVIPMLQALPPASGPSDTRPYLEVRVLVEKPEPTLRQKVEDALVGRHAQLVKITQVGGGDHMALADAMPRESLEDLLPETVFKKRYRRDHDGDPSPPLLAAFHEIIEQVARDEV